MTDPVNEFQTATERTERIKRFLDDTPCMCGKTLGQRSGEDCVMPTDHAPDGAEYEDWLNEEHAAQIEARLTERIDPYPGRCSAITSIGRCTKNRGHGDECLTRTTRRPIGYASDGMTV